jgi:phosphatidylglycerophosphate synthase
VKVSFGVLGVTLGMHVQLDGYVAKRYNIASTLGSYLDPLADKVRTLLPMDELNVSRFFCYIATRFDRWGFIWWGSILFLSQCIFSGSSCKGMLRGFCCAKRLPDSMK